MRRRRWLLAAVVGAALLAAGARAQEDGPELIERPSGVEVHVAPELRDHPPRRVVVLPFQGPPVAAPPAVPTAPAAPVEHGGMLASGPASSPAPGDGLGAEEVRNLTFAAATTFRNHFSQLPFEDVEPRAIERALARIAPGTADAGALTAEQRRALAREVGADAYVVGALRGVDQLFLLTYGRIRLQAEVSLVRAEDGALLWRARHEVSHHEGGLPTSIVGAVFTAVTTLLNLDAKARLALTDELARGLVAELPVEQAGSEAPRLLHAAHTGGGGPLPADATVTFTAAFDRPLQMLEVRFGDAIRLPMVASGTAGEAHLYQATYRVRGRDRLRDRSVVYEGRDALGNRVSATDPSGLLTFDTTRPEPPKGLTASRGPQGMDLTWTAPAAGDVVRYEILRSAAPLDGFVVIAATQFTRFTDTNAPADGAYYKVRGVDRAGNASDTGRSVRGHSVAAGPTPVPPTLAGDVVWVPAGSPYVLSGDVTLAPGAVLRIEPGTRVEAGAGSLRVEGQVLAVGTAEAPIAWAGGAGWRGITVRGARPDRESVFRHVQFSGAETALAVAAAEPEVANCLFLGNETGLKVSADAWPAVRGNTFRNNGTAVSLEAADPVLEDNAFKLNGIGVAIAAAAPLLRGNDFSGQQAPVVRVHDQGRAGIIQAAENWWGSVRAAEVAERVSGAVNANPALDAAPPLGRPVALRQDPAAAPDPVPSPAAERAEIRPEEAVARLREGGRLLDDGRPREAIARLAPLTALARNNAALFYGLALAHYQVGEAATALEHIETALHLNAHAPHMHLSRGLILEALGRSTEARAAIAEAARLAPRNRAVQAVLAGAMAGP